MEEGKSGGDIQVGAAGDKNKLMAILAYIGPFVVVSYLTAKDDSFVKFHIKQGLVLLVLWVGIWILGGTFWSFGLWFVWNIVRLVISAFAIVGIVYAAQGKEKELPLIGQYAKYFKF